MTISITGSSGFIGSRLLKKFPDAKIIKHEDIALYRRYECDQLFFLSTYGNMAHHLNYQEMLNANVADLFAILSTFRGWMCYMSSSSVTLPVQTPYSRFKRAGEEIVLGFPEIEPCVVRLFSVTGVGEQKEHLIPTLIRSCMEGNEMAFDPGPTHDFVDVADVVDALIRLSDDRASGVFEFGNRIAISNEEVRRLVEEVTGRKASITNVAPMRSYDNEDWCCKTTNRYWQPTKSLRQSITEMVEQYRHEHA
jgi:nucleoside-diphosphate-sugar epimerase